MIRLKQKTSSSSLSSLSSSSATPDLDAFSEQSGKVENNSTDSAKQIDEESRGIKLLGIGGKSSRTDGGKKSGKKKTPGEIRIQKGAIYIYIYISSQSLLMRVFSFSCLRKDITDLDGGSVAQVDFPNPNDLTNFSVM